MGYEIRVKYHPKKSEGIGYDAETVEEQTKKVGKPFDDTGLEKLAGAVMAQLARRDVMVVDLEIDELIRRPVKFKEAADGRGIILKNKKFSLDKTASLVADDFIESEINEIDPNEIPEGMQPHEIMAMKRQSQPEALDTLYNKPDAQLAVRRNNAPVKAKVDQRRVLYQVLFEPGIYEGQAQERSLKFAEGQKYPVHAVRENPKGGAFGNMLSVTDDTGRIVELEEVFFTPAGAGLVADELGFSDEVDRSAEPKLSYHNELTNHPAGVDMSQVPEEFRHIPLDDGSVPINMDVPDIRRRG